MGIMVTDGLAHIVMETENKNYLFAIAVAM